jgi:muramoyltetrapeptide carboxypeptidase
MKGGDRSDPQAEVNALLDEYFGRLGIPVIAGFPGGHAQYNLTLPMGARAEIDVDRGRLKLLERPVS